MKVGYARDEAAILYSLVRKQQLVDVLMVSEKFLAMPLGIDMSVVVRDFVESSSQGVYLAAAREDALVFSKCLLKGVAWLHSQQVLHLDIKPRNMLLMSHGAVVLSDFGCATRQSLCSGAGLAWGTVGYRCPEHPTAGTGADVWSVGVVLRMIWEMPLGEGIVYHPPACVRSAISLCLEEDPSKRPNMGALLEEPAWEAVAARCTQYMCWVAEYRLRTTSWYSYRITFRGDVDPALQCLMLLLREQILAQGRGDGHVADQEWCAADAD